MDVDRCYYLASDVLNQESTQRAALLLNVRKARKSRIFPFLGPAVAAYLIADAASSPSGLDQQGWLLSFLSFALTMAPLGLRGLVDAGVRGARRVGLLGTLCGIGFIASLDSHLFVRDLTFAFVFSLASFLVVDVALAERARRGRLLLASISLTVAFAASLATLPAFEFGGETILVPASWRLLPPYLGLVAIGFALFLRLLRKRLGSSPEILASGAWAIMGLVPALVLGILLVVLSQTDVLTWESPWIRGLTALGVCVFLFGHIASIDPRKRPRAGRSVRSYVAGALTVILIGSAAVFSFRMLPVEPISFGIVSAIGWVGGFQLWRFSKRVVHRLLAPYSGRLLDALAGVGDELGKATSLSEIAQIALSLLRDASGDNQSDPVLWILSPPLEARLDAARNSQVRDGEFPCSLRSFFDEAPGTIIIADEVHAQVVRRPTFRTLSEFLDTLDGFCVVPLNTIQGELEGALLLPRGRRASALSLEELEALRKFGENLAAVIALVAARDRAYRKLGVISQERDRLEERMEEVQDAVNRLQAGAKTAPGDREDRFSPLVSYSPAMQALQNRIVEIAPSDTPLLLYGEEGAPVESVARRIHEQSLRADGPFVVAQCTRIAEQESSHALLGTAEYEGWIRRAAGGTLLLKDVLALSFDAQQALVDALSSRQSRTADEGSPYPVEMRVIATARRSLEPLAMTGSFHSELAHWLTRIELHIPLLRERKEDIPSLVLLALNQASRVTGQPIVGIAQRAVEVLVEYEWPGDWYELQSAMEHALESAQGTQILRKHLPSQIREARSLQSDVLDGTYAEIERRVLERALHEAKGNKSEAARLLELKRTTFVDKLRRHQIEMPKRQKSTKRANDAA